MQPGFCRTAERREELYRMNEVFPFDISDIVFLLNLKIRRKNQTSWDCDCPFCGKEGKLNINLEKNVFRCNKCGEGGGQLQLYSKVYGLDRATACEQIKNYLGKGIQAPEYESFKKTVKSKPEVIHADRAPDRVLHQTYSTFLSMLTLSETHGKNLLERGLSMEQIQKNGYKSTPVFGFRKLTERLIEAGCTVEGVPGFYQEEDGAWSIRFKRKCSGFLIPVRTIEGYIVGMQIRLDYPFDHTKYIWLSSINDKMGTSSGSPIHFVGNPRDEIVFLTEGPLKGDIASFLSGRSFACVPGVNQYANLPELIAQLKRLRVKMVYETYDMDKLLNTVCQADYNTDCVTCAFRQEKGKHQCLKKIEKRKHIQNGCRKLYGICKELLVPCKQFVWDLDQEGAWAGNLKGVDDWLLDLECKASE
ncbi:DNA primase [Hungatella hathewayi]|uniref:DNA primase n=2 Tax=Hungatella hathewayi TaxID=154046 RepID=A0A374NYG9_9FIRM|nr:DNA primase [Hungatella hathewayi]MCC3396131.1 DNA primase [Clostridiales bacterium AHG0011]RGI95324.1 DNA primase [Hungatella hathewayi]RHB64155.1 DNA primase [Hungatella hathewayi]